MSRLRVACYVGGYLCQEIASYCRSGIGRSWCGGERTGGLENLVNRFKFNYAHDAYIPLGGILLATLPQLPSSTVVVPIPAVRSHVRQRGYDHALLLARYIAKERNLAFSQALRRRTSTVRRGANRRARTKQVKEAYGAATSLRSDVPYLLIDAVVTTGSTMRYTAKALRGAGATIVWAAASTRQVE